MEALHGYEFHIFSSSRAVHSMVVEILGEGEGDLEKATTLHGCAVEGEEAVEALYDYALHIFSSREEGEGTPRLCSGGREWWRRD